MDPNTLINTLIDRPPREVEELCKELQNDAHVRYVSYFSVVDVTTT